MELINWSQTQAPQTNYTQLHEKSEYSQKLSSKIRYKIAAMAWNNYTPKNEENLLTNDEDMTTIYARTVPPIYVFRQVHNDDNTEER